MFVLLTPISIASDSDTSIKKQTNRGNKLKRKAKFVSEGRLDQAGGPRTYKRVSIIQNLRLSFVDPRNRKSISTATHAMSSVGYRSGSILMETPLTMRMTTQPSMLSPQKKTRTRESTSTVCIRSFSDTKIFQSTC